MVDFVDIHSHTLPGVDDGSPSFEVSLAMLEVALGQGVGTMVLTPHLRPIDGLDQEQEHRERFAELQAAVRDAGLEIELHLGSEIAFRFNMPEVAAWPSGHLAAVVVGRGAGAGFAVVRRDRSRSALQPQSGLRAQRQRGFARRGLPAAPGQIPARVGAAKVFAQQKGKNWFFPTPVGAWNEPLKDR